jgi:hypothetical protein
MFSTDPWGVKKRLNDYFSALDRPRELNLISLELSRNEDSEYVFKVF